MIFPSDKDPMGQAIHDYYTQGKSHKLTVHSSMFDDDELPVDHLFRTESEMNALERTALSLASGRVLDVGAGSGCHALPLQNHGLAVTTIDVSPLCVQTQRERGVQNAQLADFFTDDFGAPFDTILMLMNGIGICGGITELPAFFARLDQLLAPGGCVLTDSCDLAYIYADENGNIDLSDTEGYYGEVDYQMRYAHIEGMVFNWLYIDFDTLVEVAAKAGYHAELLRQGDSSDYLAKITRLAQK